MIDAIEESKETPVNCSFHKQRIREIISHRGQKREKTFRHIYLRRVRESPDRLVAVTCTKSITMLTMCRSKSSKSTFVSSDLLTNIACDVKQARRSFSGVCQVSNCVVVVVVSVSRTDKEMEDQLIASAVRPASE